MKSFKTFAAFRYRNYRFLWLSTAFANSGRWAFTVGVSWLVFSISHSSALMGAAMFCSMIPAVIFNPFVGVLADRYDRRILLSIALFVCATGTGLLGVMTALHITTVWMVLVCAFLVGIAFSVQMTSSNALMPNLIPKHVLFNASALQGTVNQGSEFMGSALATPLLALAGPAAVFGLCFCLYIAAGVQSMWIQAPGQPASGVETIKRHRMFRPIGEGIRYILATAPLGALVVVVALHCSLTMAYTVLLPQFAQDVLQGGSATYGTLMTVIGFGAIVGTIGTASMTQQHGLGRLYLITAIVSGISLFALGSVQVPVLAYVSGFFVGSSQAVFMAVSLAFLMQPTDDHYRGRVSSVYSFMAAGFMALANFGYGLLGSVVHPRIIMWCTGGGFMLLFIIGMVLVESVRKVCRGDIGGVVIPAAVVDAGRGYKA